MTRPRLRFRLYAAAVAVTALTGARILTPAPAPAGTLVCCRAASGAVYEWTPGHGWWHWVVTGAVLSPASTATAQSIAHTATVSPTPLTDQRGGPS
jgi:hypothetical protein